MIAEAIAQRHQQLVQGGQFRSLGTDEPMQSRKAGRLAALPSSLQGSEMVVQFSSRHRPQLTENILVVLRLPQVRAPTGENRIDDRDQAAHRSPPMLRPPGVAFMRTR